MNRTTSVLRVLVTILTCTFHAGAIHAQVTDPAVVNTGGTEGQAKPATSTPPAVMHNPDISGNWESHSPPYSELIIRKVKDRDGEFEIQNTTDNMVAPFTVNWSDEAQQFLGDQTIGQLPHFYLKVLPNRTTLRATRWQARLKEVKDEKLPRVPHLDEASKEDWTRKAPEEAAEIKIFSLANVDAQAMTGILDTIFPNQSPPLRFSSTGTNNQLIAVGTEEALLKVQAILLRLDEDSPKTSMPLRLPGNAATDARTSKKLQEQLRVSEAIATTEAERIRKLQTAGQAQPDQQKLKTLLGTAFDVKLQLEESQIKVLQSKLGRLESQIVLRKTLREQIIARRANELLDGDALKWTPGDSQSQPKATTAQIAGQQPDPDAVGTPAQAKNNSDLPLAGTNQQSGAVATPETLPASQTKANSVIAKRIEKQLNSFPAVKTLSERQANIDLLQIQLGNVELEYYHDRSKAKELDLAIDKLRTARGEQALIWQKFDEAVMDVVNTRKYVDRQLHVNPNLVESGTNERLANESLDQLHRDIAEFDKVCQRVAIYSSEREKFTEGGLDVKLFNAISSAATSRIATYQADFARALLEQTIGAKLELVNFDDLNLPFKTALRVRESNERYNADDLIVALHGQFFQSWDKALVALESGARKGYGSRRQTAILEKGLAGALRLVDLDATWDENYTIPGDSHAANAKFELRVRREGNNEIETEYVNGVILSPDGLAAIPFSSKSLAPGEPIISYGEYKGSAHLVATDEEHGISLVKIESPGHEFFQWLNCRVGMPAKGQSLSDAGNSYPATVFSVDQPYPKPWIGTDAFVVERTENVVVVPGSMYLAKDGTVQGITMPWKYVAASSEKQPSPEGASTSALRSWAIPAIHFDRLLKSYRSAPSK